VQIGGIGLFQAELSRDESVEANLILFVKINNHKYLYVIKKIGFASLTIVYNLFKNELFLIWFIG
jgi:hypothetical protein